MRFALLFGVMGCRPVDGALLSGLSEEGLQGVESLGDRPLREHGTADLSGRFEGFDVADGYVVESSDPDVLAVPSVDDLIAQGQDVDSYEGDQAIRTSPDGNVNLELQTGRAGWATLTLLDPSGDPIDEVEVEVRPATRAVAVPMGAARWETTRGLEPRSVSGSMVGYVVEVFDASGERLGASTAMIVVGGTDCWPAHDLVDPRQRAEAEELCRQGLYAPGVHQISVQGAPPVEFEVVDRADVVSLGVRESDEEVLVVGLDRRGREVRGIYASWETFPGSDGDLYRYERDDSADPTPLIATWNGLTATAEVSQLGPGKVRMADDTSDCSTAAVRPEWLVALIALIGVRRRSGVR